MSTEIKDIPEEFKNLIDSQVHEALKSAHDKWTPADSTTRYGDSLNDFRSGAYWAYRHLSPSPQTEIRRSTIDQLYQSILASGQPFPGELRDIFHKVMNSLPTSPSSKPEIGLRWVPLSNRFPEDYTNSIIRQRSTKRLLTDADIEIADGEWFVMSGPGEDRIYYTECEWLEEIPSSEPAKEPQPGMSAKDFITWCADETKFLAQRDKDFFYMGAGRLFEVLAKMPSPQPEPSEEKEDSLHKSEWNSLTERQKNDFINNSLGRTADGNKSMFIHTDKGTVEASDDLNESIGKIETALNTHPSPPSVDKFAGYISDDDKKSAAAEKFRQSQEKFPPSLKPEREDKPVMVKKAECTCIYGPTDANPNCTYPNCFKPEQDSQPSPTSPAVQQEDGEVPEEIAKWIESIHDGRWGFRPGAVAMYLKTQQEIAQINEYRKEGKRYSEMLEDKLTGLDKECSALRQEFDERLKLQIQLEAQLATIRQEKENYVKHLWKMKTEAFKNVSLFKDADTDDEISELRYWYGKQCAYEEAISKYTPQNPTNE